jgi:hypothetical protein
VVGDPDVVAVGFGYLHSQFPEVFAEAGEELCGGLVVGYDSDAADLLHGEQPYAFPKRGFPLELDSALGVVGPIFLIGRRTGSPVAVSTPTR